MEDAYLCLKRGQEEEKLYPVQFAPEKLRLSVTGRKTRARRDFSERNGKISDRRYERQSFSGINLDFHLLFDKSREKGESVQSDVEGLLEALRTCAEDTKLSFCWNDMVFSGTLKQISAEYQMFDDMGNPVRASADLTICCQDQKGIRDILEQDYRSLFQ